MKKISATSALILIPIVSALALTACRPDKGDDDPAAAAETLEQALAPREVQLIRPEVREEHATLELVGEVRPFDTLKISSEVAGKVDRVLVKVGDRVQPGTPLLEVDRETFHIYLEQAEANLAAAQADLNLAAKALERKRDLLTDDTIPQAAFDEAEAAHELARARVAAAEAARSLAARNSERSVVRAPASGAITERHVVAGQWTDVGERLLEMAIGNTVKIAARVPEAWAAKLSGLETFEFTVGPAGGRREARLYSVQPVVEEASRSFEIVGVAKVNDGELRPGMFANVICTSPQPLTTLWLPAAAVATSDMSQVMMVADDVVVFRRVRIGRRLDAMIEIVDGLSAEDAVIAEVAGLHRGLPVLIVGGADDE
ncbi:MAG: efflux RND transporter periplasmic adaptor subunit [Acidobacteria bacterium]|nr:efflux RND transporter periplasmic adaptor subunit [Acidobacteriota bacterium]